MYNRCDFIFSKIIIFCMILYVGCENNVYSELTWRMAIKSCSKEMLHLPCIFDTDRLDQITREKQNIDKVTEGVKSDFLSTLVLLKDCISVENIDSSIINGITLENCVRRCVSNACENVIYGHDKCVYKKSALHTVSMDACSTPIISSQLYLWNYKVFTNDLCSSLSNFLTKYCCEQPNINFYINDICGAVQQVQLPLKDNTTITETISKNNFINHRETTEATSNIKDGIINKTVCGINTKCINNQHDETKVLSSPLLAGIILGTVTFIAVSVVVAVLLFRKFRKEDLFRKQQKDIRYEIETNHQDNSGIRDMSINIDSSHNMATNNEYIIEEHAIKSEKIDNDNPVHVQQIPEDLYAKVIKTKSSQCRSTVAKETFFLGTDADYDNLKLNS